MDIKHRFSEKILLLSSSLRQVASEKISAFLNSTVKLATNKKREIKFHGQIIIEQESRITNFP